MISEQATTITVKKGGRPKKAVRMDQIIAIKCTASERKIIEQRASSIGFNTSEYLRQLGLNGKIEKHEKIFPKDILAFNAMLRHIAANLNQTAKKRNSGDELNAVERAELKILSEKFTAIAAKIETYL